MQIQPLTGKWQFHQAGVEEWSPAVVPGGIHTDLMAIGRIPDPFVADNEKRVQWVAESDWTYRTSFTCAQKLLDQEKVQLVCDGLDTLATVVLNGHDIGHPDNMFRQYQWEVKSSLNAKGANNLTITFSSPVKVAAARQAVRPLPGVSQALPGGPHLRKAPCQFGWDWGPQLPPIGIWKDIRLEGYSQARLADVHLRQEHAAEGVMLEVRAGIQRWNEAPLAVVLRVTSPGGEVLEKPAAVSAQGEALIRLPIPHPELWWPNGYGAQPLYRVEVTLEQGQTTEVLDRRTYQVGLRTIELRQQEDPWGRSFVFVVNGVPIFAKGSNWIPADSFPTRLTEASLEGLIRAAAETHQNMLRIWGGGFYEDERFYDLCDRYGILVWQEFIFSCSIYPLDDPAFLENVRGGGGRERPPPAPPCQPGAVVRQQRDGMGLGRTGIGSDPSCQELKAAYDRFFHHTLPDWVPGRGPRPRLLAQLALLQYPVSGSERPAPGRCPLLGCLARA